MVVIDHRCVQKLCDELCPRRFRTWDGG